MCVNLRKLAGSAIGASALLAVANRLLAARAPGIDPPLDREQTVYRWRGFDVAYTAAGDPADPDLVLLHGIHVSASSREFAAVVDALADDHHVLSPDLPGFGCSDRPSLVYGPSLYRTFVADFLRDVAEEPTVVASSLTGAHVAAALADSDRSVAGLFLVCPTADTGPGRPWLRTLLRAPVVGQGLFNLLVSRPSIRYFLQVQAHAHPGAVPEDWVDHAWATAHQPGARYAPASFLAGSLDTDVDLAPALADVDGPVTLVWGREATLTPPAGGRDLAERANVRLLVVDDAALVPHAEQPDSFVSLLTGDAGADPG